MDAFADGSAAVEAVTRAGYDAVLMDRQRPVMDGYAATADIRRRQSDRVRPPIVAVTACAMKGDAERALADGMDDDVTKPIDGAESRLALSHLPCAGPSDPVALPPEGEALGEAFDRGTLDQLAVLFGSEDDVRVLVRMFVGETPARVGALADAAARGDVEAVAEAAHTIKGAAQTLGARTLALVTAGIESEARVGCLPGPDDLSSLRAALDRVVADPMGAPTS